MKGAPETVLAQSTYQKAEAGQAQPLTGGDYTAALGFASQMAGEGLLVLAFAEKMMPTESESPDEAEKGLTFVGLVGLLGPLRKVIREALVTSRGAGIHTVPAETDIM